MAKEKKSEYFHLRMTPKMKSELFTRAADLDKEPSVYITELIKKDLSGFDLDETEKPRMKEFAQLIGVELANFIIEDNNKASLKTKEREEQILALLYYQYKVSSLQFYNLALRVKTSGQLKNEDLKICEEESKKVANITFEKYLDQVLSKNAESIIEFIKKPF